MSVVRIAVDNPYMRSDAGPWFSREFPLGIYLRVRRRRRLLHRLHRTAQLAARGMGGEAELSPSAKTVIVPRCFMLFRPTSGAEAFDQIEAIER